MALKKLLFERNNYLSAIIIFQNDPSWMDLKPDHAKEVASLAKTLVDNIGNSSQNTIN
jgi:hypothetical protein